MLRITIHDAGQEMSIVVEGKLAGPWVTVLEKCWQKTFAADPSMAMQVNLAAVTFVDNEGKGLLTKMRLHGAKLVSRGCLINAIVEEIETEVAKGKDNGSQLQKTV